MELQNKAFEWATRDAIQCSKMLALVKNTVFLAKHNFMHTGMNTHISSLYASCTHYFQSFHFYRIIFIKLFPWDFKESSREGNINDSCLQFSEPIFVVHWKLYDEINGGHSSLFFCSTTQ